MFSKAKSRVRRFIGNAVSQALIPAVQRPMVYMGGNKALTRLVYGQKIYVDTRDLSLAPHILLDCRGRVGK